MAYYIKRLRNLTKEEIIGLTGLRALHPDSDTDFDIRIVEIEGTNSYLIYGDSKYFSFYVVKVDGDLMTIENVLIVSSRLKENVLVDCLKLQAENALGLNFDFIELVASRQDRPSTLFGVEIEKMIGYRVMGRYGYIIDDPDKLIEFQNMMKDNGFPQVLHLHDLNKPNTEEANVFWKVKGNAWYGKFPLEEGGESRRILQDLN